MPFSTIASDSSPLDPGLFNAARNTVRKHTYTSITIQVQKTSLSYIIPTLINNSSQTPMSIPLTVRRYVSSRLMAMVHRFNIAVTTTISSLSTEVTASTIDTHDPTSIPK